MRRVGVDYHVDVEGHFYSVPYRFARSEGEVRRRAHNLVCVDLFAPGASSCPRTIRCGPG
jgi:hypothetical protein